MSGSSVASIMTPVYLPVALAFCCALLSTALGDPVRWLMQGDMITDEEAKSRDLRLNSRESYLSVEARGNEDYQYTAQPGKIITCVIAASVYGNGYVDMVEGGYGTERVRILYQSTKDKPDVFYAYVQAAGRKWVSVDRNVVSNARLGIVYEPMANWSRQEIDDALRNPPNASFLTP